MLICEDVMILLAEPRGMIENWDARRQWSLTAGALCDLEELGAIAIEGKQVRVLSEQATGHAALETILTRIVDRRDRKLPSILRDSAACPLEDIIEGLSARGVLELKSKSRFGLLPSRYTVTDSTVENNLRAAMTNTLHGRGNRHHLSVLAIINSVEVVHQALKHEAAGVKDREISALLEDVKDSSTMMSALRSSTRGIGSALPAIAGGM
ncbi:hypothetical protein KEM60_01538 [Austwickia sp. TVS 96-490-7B]|uniref:GOLPH3/VPS74 family protein n=1 Tax=Austwickia sp. TVS 96-490-7B TaxID=2830843 RepID=UPI001C59159B|nr:GPP34 family phosphoprotein [Austwickia sp. TVS 96-490-7B]MBW3085341.1 hypothetical protein [Austwickia sp. TVS 96-490-7B]